MGSNRLGYHILDGVLLSRRNTSTRKGPDRADSEKIACTNFSLESPETSAPEPVS